MRRYRPSFFISSAFKGMWRNRMMTVASVIVLLSCLIVTGCFSMLLININTNLDSIGDLNEIVVFVYADAPYLEGDERTLPEGPASENNTFLGWTTELGGTEVQYEPGDKYKVNPDDAVAGEIRFYAVWENTPNQDKFTASFNLSGVALENELSADTTEYTVGSTITFPDDPVPQNPTLKFKGWSLSHDGSTGAITGEYIISEQDVKGGRINFYAIWNNMPEFEEYTLAYDSNGEVTEPIPSDSELKLKHVKEQIALLDNVAENGISYVPKNETLKDQLDQYKDYPGLQSFLTDGENPFPDTFLVTYEDNSKIDSLELQLESIEGVDKVRCRADIAKTIENLKSGVVMIFSWFMVILFIVSIFVIINTIKLTVANRSEEISIMRYLGATKWFISLPFQLEGAIIGVFSGLLAFFVQWYVYGYIHKMVAADLSMIEIVPFSKIGVLIFFGCIITGVLTGLIGSMISIRKNLKA
ncbi:MAG: permease-like cell division protein FtsX [Clostridia bacterium]|nr:permease-like cell division protein FtsX [Clostridia bacterium]